jgi:hypothetical protein
MARFYGGVEGNRGPATRQGSRESGISVYAQSYDSRITVDYNEVRFDESTRAHITLGGGWTTYYRGFMVSFDPDLVSAGLDTGDDKMMAIWKRIQGEFAKLEKEAPKAIRRSERRARAAA